MMCSKGAEQECVYSTTVNPEVVLTERNALNPVTMTKDDCCNAYTKTNSEPLLGACDVNTASSTGPLSYTDNVCSSTTTETTTYMLNESPFTVIHEVMSSE